MTQQPVAGAKIYDDRNLQRAGLSQDCMYALYTVSRALKPLEGTNPTLMHSGLSAATALQRKGSQLPRSLQRALGPGRQSAINFTFPPDSEVGNYSRAVEGRRFRHQS